MRAVVLTLALLASLPATAEDVKPKLGPEAVPLTADNAYFRTAAAPDFWNLASFYVPQFSNSACSVASLVMAINALRGLPPGSEDNLLTQFDLQELLGDEQWVEQVREDGDGVSFDEFVAYADASFKTMDLTVEIATGRPAGDAAASLEALRAVLAKNEESPGDVLLVYFNQGVITGDWDGPHISPVGAYDAANDRVLVMDIDRDWYVPYWTKTATLHAAMLRPAPEDQGVLAGETGGWVHVKRKQ